MIVEMGLEADVKIYFEQFKSLILDELVDEEELSASASSHGENLTKDNGGI